MKIKTESEYTALMNVKFAVICDGMGGENAAVKQAKSD